MKVNVNSKKLIRQLGVIEEGIRKIKEGLEDIEINSCVDCGGELEETNKIYADNRPIAQIAECTECGTKQYVNFKPVLSKTLKGFLLCAQVAVKE